jgi:hypothetical protein
VVVAPDAAATTQVPDPGVAVVNPTAAVLPPDALDMELSGVLRGLEPASLLALQPHEPLATVSIAAPPIRLDEIVVTGARFARSERLERVGFYRRRDAGFGRFYDRRDIQGLGVHDLADMFLATPGIARRCVGMNCNLFGHRGFAGFDNPDGCEFQYFVDGVLGSGPGGLGGDIGFVEAIEIYSGPSQLPPQFHGWGGACGAIVVWTQF